MKNLTPFFIFSIVILMTSCVSTPDKEEQVVQESESSSTEEKVVESFIIDPERSVVNWKGSMLKMKSHTGTLKVTGGKVLLVGGEILSGGFTVDMTSMAATDYNYDSKNTSDKLISHLSSKEFFEVDKYPIASIIFSGQNMGSLSIKNQTHKESFKNFGVLRQNETVTLRANMTINRQRYGVTYSGLADKPIDDAIELDAVLVVQ